MLIRSQSKKTLYNLNKVKALFVNNGCIHAESSLIGEYSTEEKALKVLDMIQECYTSSLYTEQGLNCLIPLEKPRLIVNNKVFQMPQDNKVE